MKTAISIPDATFDQVTRSAQAHGLSRSEFFTRAAVAYLEELEAGSLTAGINAAVELVGDDEDTQVVVESSKRRFRELPDEW